jgi:hypothetical protein
MIRTYTPDNPSHSHRTLLNFIERSSFIMAGSFFKKLSNDVLEATEQVANRMEEGLALLFNGGEPQRNNAGQNPASADHNPPFHEYDDEQEHLEEAFRNNPLQGIADSVVGDIMSGQVGSWRAL